MEASQRERKTKAILEELEKLKSLGLKKTYDRSRVSNDGYVYTPYIVVRGNVIWHPSGGTFKFLPRS